jgi:hypothetical protein
MELALDASRGSYRWHTREEVRRAAAELEDTLVGTELRSEKLAVRALIQFGNYRAGCEQRREGSLVRATV